MAVTLSAEQLARQETVRRFATGEPPAIARQIERSVEPPDTGLPSSGGSSANRCSHARPCRFS